jgi:hypothetical protein
MGRISGPSGGPGNGAAVVLHPPTSLCFCVLLTSAPPPPGVWCSIRRTLVHTGLDAMLNPSVIGPSGLAVAVAPAPAPCAMHGGLAPARPLGLLLARWIPAPGSWLLALGFRLLFFVSKGSRKRRIKFTCERDVAHGGSMPLVPCLAARLHVPDRTAAPHPNSLLLSNNAEGGFSHVSAR